MSFKINRDKSNRHVAMTPWEKYQSEERKRTAKKPNRVQRIGAKLPRLKHQKKSPSCTANGHFDRDLWDHFGHIGLLRVTVKPHRPDQCAWQSGTVQAAGDQTQRH
ncbi:hypothetical protein [Secundilactobacillus silagei]|uniref:hypothetical protein n=1 Tax=Secundilactobacillus silagei TaxID=1293415 RepID=UPI00209216F1|nr:hypothetical protein [Secundilactobacillus silagei]